MSTKSEVGCGTGGTYLSRGRLSGEGQLHDAGNDVWARGGRAGGHLQAVPGASRAVLFHHSVHATEGRL